MGIEPSQPTPEEHIAAVQQLGEWLRDAGVESPGLAVDMIDAVAAGRQVEKLVDQIVRIDVSESEGANKVLEHLGTLHALLFTELKPHLRNLEKAWPRFERAIISRSSGHRPDK